MVSIFGRLANNPRLDHKNRARFTLVSSDGEHLRFTRCVVSEERAELVIRKLQTLPNVCVVGDWATPTEMTLNVEGIVLQVNEQMIRYCVGSYTKDVNPRVHSGKIGDIRLAALDLADTNIEEIARFKSLDDAREFLNQKKNSIRSFINAGMTWYSAEVYWIYKIADEEIEEFVDAAEWEDQEIASKLERARQVLKEEGLEGMQVFDCESFCDINDILYQDKEIKINANFNFGYVEILGLDNSDFEELTELRGTYRFIKKEL